MLDAQQSPPLTRNQRLDRLPLNSQHKRLLVGSGLGWALDAMDVGLISFVMAALIKHWGLTHGQTSVLASAGFVGMAIGATFGGLLADKWGRRNVFALTLLVYGLATGASALAGGLAVLIVLRFIVGLGLGAELPVASTLVSEFAPLRHRGRLVVILEAFWAVGWILAAIIGAFVVSASDSGWRWALVLGCVPALYSAYVRSSLPESVRFLEARGRHDEAEAAVQQFEKASATIPDTPVIATEDPADQADSIFAPNMRRRTFGLWTVWFCINLSYYGAFIWIPSLLVADGFSLVKSFQFTLIITLAQFPGYALAAWLIEIWGPPHHTGSLPPRLRRLRSPLRICRHHSLHHRRWLLSLLLQPRRVGRALRHQPRALPLSNPRHRHRISSRIWPHRVHHRTADRSPHRGRRRHPSALRTLRGGLPRSSHRRIHPARTTRQGPRLGFSQRAAYPQTASSAAGEPLGWCR